VEIVLNGGGGPELGMVLPKVQTSLRKFYEEECIPLVKAVNPQIYPNGILIWARFFLKTLEKLKTKFIENPASLTVWEREVAAVVECLLIYNINGNPRNLSHSLFKVLNLKQNILYYNFPYITRSVVGENFDRFLTGTYLCGNTGTLSLHQQQAGHRVREVALIKCTNLCFDLENWGLGGEVELLLSEDEWVFGRLFEVFLHDVKLAVLKKVETFEGFTHEMKSSFKDIDVKSVLQHISMNQHLFEKVDREMSVEETFSRYFFTKDGKKTEVAVEMKGYYFSLALTHFCKYGLKDNISLFENRWTSFKDSFFLYLKDTRYIPEMNKRGFTGKVTLFLPS
jgi:hypothetical protein